MALTPDVIQYGKAVLEVTGLTSTHRTEAVFAEGTTYPNATVASGTTRTINITKTGQTVNTAWGVALVEDDVDVNGDFTNEAGTVLTEGVLAYKAFDGGINGTFSVVLGDGSDSVNPPITKGGTYRLVLTYGGNSASSARNASSVNTTSTSLSLHEDSDGSSARGGLATESVNERHDGVGGTCVINTARNYSAGDWAYPQQNTLTASIRSAVDGVSGLIKPKEIKLGLTNFNTSSPVGVGQGKLFRVTPSNSGDIVLNNIKVDTDFSQIIGGEGYYTQLGVNNVLGDSTTPLNEQAGLFRLGIPIIGLNNTQLAAYVFASTGHASGITFENINRVRTTQPEVTISSGVQVFEDAGKAVPGVAPFKTNAYTTRQDLFKRRGPSVLTNAVPYLETYVFDAFGNPLTNTPVTARSVRLSNSSVENSQNLTTDANGRVRWNYTLSATNPAFNRYIKTGSSRQSGSHVGAGPDTKTGWSYFYSNINSSDPATYNSPVAGYPRRIEIEGRVFGSKEPTTNDPNVFGVTSEGLVESIWTGTLTAADIDSNGVPTGAGTAGQQLGAGSLKAKSTSKVDPATLRVIDVNRHNIRDAAGRIVDVTSDRWYRASGVFNDTLDSVHQPVASGNDSQTQLENSLGYNSNPNSLDTIAPPTDPASLKYFLSLADTTAQRNSFSMTVSGNDPVVGFTTDSGNFVYKQQVVSFEALDSSVAAIITSETLQSDPTLVRRFIYKAFRVAADVAINPDTGFNGVDTDGPPTYAVWVQPDGGGAIEVLETGTMLPVVSEPSADWYFDLVIPLGYKMIKVFAVARVNGSPIIGGEKLPVQIGYEFDAIGSFVGFHFK